MPNTSKSSMARPIFRIHKWPFSVVDTAYRHSFVRNSSHVLPLRGWIAGRAQLGIVLADTIARNDHEPGKIIIPRARFSW